MRIQVLSEPYGATLGGTTRLLDIIADATRYDEDVLKPALLLASEVSIRSWRMDCLELVKTQAVRYRYPVPLVGMLLSVLERDNPSEISGLGINPENAVILRETALRLGLLPWTDVMPEHSQIVEMAQQPSIREFARTQLAQLSEVHGAMSSPAIDSLVDRGLVTQGPWDDREWRNFPEAWYRRAVEVTGPEGSLTYGRERLMAALRSTESQLMLDPYMIAALRVDARSGITSDVLTLRNANALLRLVDELSSAPLDEVVQVRSDLSPYLTGFRSFILKHAENFEADDTASPAELSRSAQIYWETHVAPELDEIVNGQRRNSLLRNVARVVTSGPDAAIGVGLGLVSAVGANTLGVSTIAGAAIGSLPILFKAVGATLEARGDRMASAAYFLVDARRRLRRS